MSNRPKKFIIKSFKSKPILTVKNISKSIDKRLILRKIDFKINPGEIFGLLGPNGAGKSVTFNVLLGIMRADTGDVYVSGKGISDLPIHERAKKFKIGYIPQNDSVFRGLNCEDNLKAISETLGFTPTLINARFIKPLDKSMLLSLCKEYDAILTMEEGCLAGGFGSAVVEYYNDIGSSVKISRMGIPDNFIEHDSREALLDSLDLNSIGVVNKIKAILGDSND